MQRIIAKIVLKKSRTLLLVRCSGNEITYSAGHLALSNFLDDTRIPRIYHNQSNRSIFDAVIASLNPGFRDVEEYDLADDISTPLSDLEDLLEWVTTGKVDGVGFDEESIAQYLRGSIERLKEGPGKALPLTHTLIDGPVLDALEWIVEFIDEHPDWDHMHFRMAGACESETEWFKAAKTAVNNAKKQRTVRKFGNVVIINRLISALRGLSEYAGGADTEPNHPCRIAITLLEEIDNA